MLCLYCPTPLTPATRWEHVIGCALGGRLRSRTIACDDCNNAIGAALDDPLAVAFEQVRYMLLVNDCKGEPPPSIVMRTEHGTYKLIPGEPSQLPGPIRQSNLANGRLEISVTARTRAEAAEVVAHELRRHRVNIDQAKDVTVAGTYDAKPYTQPMRFELRLGGETHLRAVAKIGLELLAPFAPDIARLPAFAKVRNHVRHGETSDCAQFDYANQPRCPYPPEKLGDAPHFAIVWAHPGAPCIAAVQLFGLFRFTVRLCERWDGDSFAYAYAVDPIAGRSVDQGPTDPPLPVALADLVVRGWPQELAEKAGPFLKAIHDRGHGEVWRRRRIDEEVSAAAANLTDADVTNPEKMLALMATVEGRPAAPNTGVEQSLKPDEVLDSIRKQLERLARRDKGKGP